jgi:hypothetical protein
MKVVIVYENMEFAIEACAALHRVGHRESVEWIVECWPTSALKSAAFAKMSLIETRDAELIILPAGYSECFPQWLRDWLNRWARVRQNTEVALAFVDDHQLAGLPQPVCSELSVLAREHGLNLIVSRNSFPKNPKKIFIDFLPVREVSVPTGRSNFPDLTTRYSYRGMGINE